jgi:hypothetical protein
MPRGIPKAKNTTEAVPDALAVQTFNSLAWFEKLTPEEKNAVQAEGRALSQALLQYGRSRLAIGEHLSKLQAILEPHSMFSRFLKTFHFNKRTAYRYIAGYNNAKAKLPEPILKAAMARGVNLIGDNEMKPLGIYTAAAAKLPPPSNPTDTQATTWLDQIEQVRRDTRAEEHTLDAGLTLITNQDPQTLLREVYRFVNLRYRRLPNNSKTRTSWVRSLVGMLLSDLGMSTQQTFAPAPIPEGFKAERGRPAAVVHA